MGSNLSRIIRRTHPRSPFPLAGSHGQGHAARAAGALQPAARALRRLRRALLPGALRRQVAHALLFELPARQRSGQLIAPTAWCAGLGPRTSTEGARACNRHFNDPTAPAVCQEHRELKKRGVTVYQPPAGQFVATAPPPQQEARK